MPFQPNVKDVLVVGGVHYSVEGHPLIANMPYGQEGRQGTVYRLLRLDTHTLWALKVFRPSFRFPALVQQAEVLASYAAMSGLQVCERTVLTPQHHFELISKHPELLYAVLMPWMDGPTWMDVLLDEQVPDQLMLVESAESLASLLSQMEQNGIAHGDLSAANIILPRWLGADLPAIALVDMEQMYAPGLNRPHVMPSGSPGYARSKGQAPEWNPAMDRYAGGLLITEMLVWHDSRIRAAAWGESYLDPECMGHDKDRINLLLQVLSELYQDRISYLFQRVWTSTDNTQCPTFAEWEVAIRQYRLQDDYPIQTAMVPPSSDAREDIQQVVSDELISSTEVAGSQPANSFLQAAEPEERAAISINKEQPLYDAGKTTAERILNVEAEALPVIQPPITDARPILMPLGSSVQPSTAELIMLAERQEQEGRWADAIRSYEQLLLYYSPASDIGHEAEQARLAALDNLLKLKEQEAYERKQKELKRRRRNRVLAAAASVLLILGGGGGVWIWSPWEASSEAAVDSAGGVTKPTVLSSAAAAQAQRSEETASDADKQGLSSDSASNEESHTSTTVPDMSTSPDPNQVDSTLAIKPESTAPPKVEAGQQPADTPTQPSTPTTSAAETESTPSTAVKPAIPPKKPPAPTPTNSTTSPTTVTPKKEDDEAGKIKALEESILYAFNVNSDINEAIRLSRELLKLDANNAIALKMIKDLTG